MSDQHSTSPKLCVRFSTLWARAVGPGEAGRAWARIEAGYGDENRAYHGFAHVAAMLADLDAARDAPLDTTWRDPDAAAVPFDAVELAVFFHDAVYDPRKGDNEAASAALFSQAAGASPRLGRAGVERVCALILATAAHEPSDDPATRLLLDLDLAVLGASPDAYAAYADAIRREYAHVPDAMWRLGRGAVLRRFLAREAIYQTPDFARRFEAAARRNLGGELAGLEA